MSGETGVKASTPVSWIILKKDLYTGKESLLYWKRDSLLLCSSVYKKHVTGGAGLIAPVVVLSWS